MNYNTKDASKLDYIADLDAALKSTTSIPEESKEHIRHQVTTDLLHKKHTVDFTNEELQAMKDLKSDDEIIILPADKGRMTVVMNKSYYIDKANNLLQDSRPHDLSTT